MYTCPINVPRSIYFSDPGNSDCVSVKHLFFSKSICEQILKLQHKKSVSYNHNNFLEAVKIVLNPLWSTNYT